MIWISKGRKSTAPSSVPRSQIHTQTSSQVRGKCVACLFNAAVIAQYNTDELIDSLATRRNTKESADLHAKDEQTCGCHGY